MAKDSLYIWSSVDLYVRQSKQSGFMGNVVELSDAQGNAKTK
jgi:hypothetical protein